MEKYDFIKMMLNNRHLSIKDKKRLVLLATREIEHSDIPIKGKKKAPPPETKNGSIHSPKDTASFLSLFNNPDGFKFLTHDFDPNSNMDYDKLLNLAQKTFFEGTSKYKIPQSLYSLMSTFIGVDNNKQGDNKKWMDCDGILHNSNYSCKEWKEWAKANPNIHLLENKDIEKEILKFRSTIRIVKPALKDIIENIKKRFSNLSVQTDKLEVADFYTYVRFLKKSIELILNDMSRYAEKFPKIEICFQREIGDDFSLRIIKICQIGSFSSSLDDVIKKFENGGGAFNEIKNTLLGYCNWSVEAIWDDIPKRWNILDDIGRDKVEEIKDGKVKGFTHVLTYYYK